MKKLKHGIALGLLLAFLCVTSAGAAPVKLVVWDWIQSRIDLLKTYTAEYTQMNPDVTFEFQPLSLGQYPDKLTASLAAGIPPDLLFFHNGFTSQFSGSLEPFPENLFPLAQIRADHIAFDQAYLIKPGDKQFYFLPAGITTGVIFYNKDLWDAAGLAAAPKTWDDLRLAGRKLTRRAGDGKLQVAGLSINGSIWTMFTDMVYQQGGWLFNEKGNGANIDTVEGRRALNYMADVVFSDRSSNVTESGFDIAKGNVGLQYKWAWYRDTLDKVKDLRYGVMPIPSFTGSMAPAIGRNNYEPSFAVPKGLDKAHRDAAFKFLRWLYDQDSYWVAMNIQNGRVPGKTRLWRNDQVRLDPTESVLAAMAPYTVFPGELPKYQWETPMGTLSSNFLKQTNSVEAILAETQRMVDARLAETPAAWVVERRYSTPK